MKKIDERVTEIYEKVKEIKKLKCVKLSPISLKLLKGLEEKDLKFAHKWIHTIDEKYHKPLKSVWESATPKRWEDYKKFGHTHLQEYQKLRQRIVKMRDMWAARPDFLKRKENADPNQETN